MEEMCMRSEEKENVIAIEVTADQQAFGICLSSSVNDDVMTIHNLRNFLLLHICLQIL